MRIGSRNRVYFIQRADGGSVKIGRSTNVSRRLATLQNAHDEKLILLREVPGGLTEEAWFHARFAHCRLSGEWFRFDPDMMVAEYRSHLGSPAAEESDEASTMTRQELSARIAVAMAEDFSAMRNATAFVSRAVGADPRAIENWMTGHCAPRATELIRLMAVSPAVRAAVDEMVEEVASRTLRHPPRPRIVPAPPPSGERAP